MTANITLRDTSMARPGHRATIAPLSCHLPATEAGRANRVRRLMREITVTQRGCSDGRVRG